MNCDRIEHLLDAFAEGELSSPQRQMVEEHLKTCPLCRKELSAIRRTIRLLTEFGEVDEPAAFVQQVRQRIETRQKHSILERLLPRPAMAKVLVSASCFMLAALGVWVLYRHFSPTEQMEKYRAGDDFRGRTIASVPTDEKGLSSKRAEELSLRSLKAGDKADLLGETLVEKEANYFDEAGLGKTKSPAAAPTDTLGTDLNGTVLAKASPMRAAWEQQTALTSEGEPHAGRETRKPEEHFARTYPGYPEERARKAGVSKTNGPVEILVEASDGDSGSAPEQLARAKGAEEKPEATVAGGREVRGIKADSATTSSSVRGALAVAPEEEERVLKYRRRPSSKEETLAYDTEGDTLVERWALWAHEPETASLEFSLEAPKPQEEKKDLSLSLQDVTLPHQKANELVQHGEGIRGEREYEILDTNGRWRFLFGNGNLVAGYAYFGRPVSELVCYVKDRVKALDEMKKIVADLGGTVDSLVKDTAKSGRGFGVQKADVFVVKLKASAYPSFRKKFIAQPQTVERGGLAGERSGRPEASWVVTQEDGTVTLLIRLTEIPQQEKSPQPPAK